MKQLLIATWIWMVCVCAAPTIAAGEPLTLDWQKNMLQISGPELPGGLVEIWYLEAFCRSGSTQRKWEETTIPHETKIILRSPQKIRLRTEVEPSVVIDHVITATDEEVEFQVVARNGGEEFVDVQWFQPCMRVDRFTGANQQSYVEKSFIYTKDGLQILSKLPRTAEAIYKGGQVYVPAGVPMADVNPRPISAVEPANDLIGCFSADGKKLLATAWDQTQELFQGVIVCLHNDPRIGGLKPQETKRLRGKVYVMENKPEELLKRYERDFKKSTGGSLEKN